MERARERGWCALCVHTTTKVLGIGQVSGDEGGGWKLFKIFNPNSTLIYSPSPFYFFSGPTFNPFYFYFSTLIYLRFRGFSPPHCNRTQTIIFALSTLYNSTQSRLVNKLSAARGAGPIPHHTVYVYSGSWGDCNNALAVTSSIIIGKIPSVFQMKAKGRQRNPRFKKKRSTI